MAQELSEYLDGLPALSSIGGAEKGLVLDGATLKSVLLSVLATHIVSLITDSAPGTLDTLNELAAALGDDPNFATTVATALGLKAPLASPALTDTPTAPTASTGTNTTQLATTAFVIAQIAAAIGVSLQAYSANLTTFAGIAPSANVQSVLGAADYAAIRALLSLVIGTDVAPVASPVFSGSTMTAPVFIGLGGLTSSFPAIKSSGSSLHIRRADDSGYADVSMRGLGLNPANNTVGLDMSGNSLTGANAQTFFNVSQTWNTSGIPTALKLNINDTASNAASLLFDFQIGGASRLSLRKDGRLNVAGAVDCSSSISCNGTSGLQFTSRSILTSASDGVMAARNNANSAFSFFQAKLQTDTNYDATIPVPTGRIKLFDATGTAYYVGAVAA